MSNFFIINHSDTPIKFSVNKKEEYIVYPKEKRRMPILAKAQLSFESEVDANLRCRKPIFKNQSLLTKEVKTPYKKVTQIDLPDVFVSFKFKNVY